MRSPRVALADENTMYSQTTSLNGSAPAFGWTVVRQTRWGRLLADESRGVVLFERSEIPCATNDDAEAVMEVLLSSISSTQHTFGLVLDLRKVRGNNAAWFEKVTASGLSTVASTFARMVCVVETMTGMLQMARLERMRGSNEEHATNDLHHAVAFAAGERPLE